MPVYALLLWPITAWWFVRKYELNDVRNPIDWIVAISALFCWGPFIVPIHFTMLWINERLSQSRIPQAKVRPSKR